MPHVDCARGIKLRDCDEAALEGRAPARLLSPVIAVNTGIQEAGRAAERWIPAFAGKTPILKVRDANRGGDGCGERIVPSGPPTRAGCRAATMGAPR